MTVEDECNGDEIDFRLFRSHATIRQACRSQKFISQCSPVSFKKRRFSGTSYTTVIMMTIAGSLATADRVSAPEPLRS